jgi:hypothetical protein
VTYAIAPSIIDSAKKIAVREGMETAAILAVISTETGGQPFEADGRTPIVLCEPAVFYHQLPAASRAEAVKEGLAYPTWDPHGYRDQGTSAGREARFARMKAFDEAAAYRSVSMGLMQIMGFNADEADCGDAKSMYEAMVGSVDVMIDCGVRFLKHTGISNALAAQDWADAARLYNGAGYKRNAYDVKLAEAYAHWHTALNSGQIVPSTNPKVLSLGNQGPAVADLQKSLSDKGYAIHQDAYYGPETQGVVAAFQVHHGIPADGIAGENTVAAIAAAAPQPAGAPDPEVVQAAVKSTAVVQHGWYAKRALEASGVGLLSGNVDLSGVNSALDKFDQAKSTWERVSDVFGDVSTAAANWLPHALSTPHVAMGVVAIAAGWFFVHSMQAAHKASEEGAVA